jgi:hypothetical protein
MRSAWHFVNRAHRLARARTRAYFFAPRGHVAYVPPEPRAERPPPDFDCWPGNRVTEPTTAALLTAQVTITQTVHSATGTQVIRFPIGTCLTAPAW